MAIEYPDAVSALYRSAHESFVPERKRLAAELKAAGDKAGAARLAKLVRPPLSAWAVNQLWWNARESFDQLFEGSGRLRRGDRTAASAHRDALVALRSRAAQLLADSGHSATDATLRRVATTLSALAAAGSFAPDPPGALAADRDPPGFDTLGAAAEGPETAPATSPETAANDTAAEAARDGAAAADGAPRAAAAKVDEATAAADAKAVAEAQAERQHSAEAERRRAAEADAERQRIAREAQARADAERQLAEERARLERERVRREDHARIAGSLRAARQEIELCAREVARLEGELRAAERRSERTRATVAELEAQLAQLERDG